MSGAKHTPGPWSLIEANDTPGHRESAFVYAGKQRWACTNQIVVANEVEANARLIAAAPDLLAALLAVETSVGKAEHDMAMLMVKVALSKAEGRL